ncbi:MAG: DUF6515 family protein [Rikenellaceae bacterium]
MFKISMIALLGVFVAMGSATAAPKDSKDNKSSKSNSKKTVVVKKPVTVSPSKVVYKSPTPAVKAVRTLPPNTKVVKNKGFEIHIANGFFYRLISGKYVSVKAPVGLRVKTLPLGYALVSILDRAYYYYQGTYYVQANNEYEVVGAPEEIIVPSLPAEAEQITIEGKDYYIYDGMIYSVVLTPDGKAFQVTGELSM